MEQAKLFEKKKFMWDGRTYASEPEANKVKGEYEENDFETHLVQEEGKYFLFTRKVVSEIKIEQ